jgi:ATP adenylyltransferase/5',5'''-P-1,P-4-tetraphosphate phosphorylase II
MTLTDLITEIKLLVTQAETELHALEGGKKAASARARKHLQNIKLQSHSLRKSITEHTSSLPVRKRNTAKKPTVEEPVEAEPVENTPAV